MVKLYEPAAVAATTVSVISDVEDTWSRVVGTRLAVTPVGSPVTCSEITPVKPPVRVAAMVSAPVALAVAFFWILSEVADAPRMNEPAAGGGGFDGHAVEPQFRNLHGIVGLLDAGLGRLHIGLGFGELPGLFRLELELQAQAVAFAD